MKAFSFKSDLKRVSVIKVTSISYINDQYFIEGVTSRADCIKVLFVSNSPNINSGDIVLLEPSGVGSILFENGSISNALFLTNQCNSKCIMCPQPPKKDSEDYFELALEIIPLIARDTEVLGITGGEPTLFKKRFLEIISKCRDFLPNTQIQLLTNGRTFKDFSFVSEINKILGKNFYACIPLYADNFVLHDKIVGVQGAFYETVEGIYNLARLSVPIELRTVICLPNFQRLPSWSDFVYRTLPFVNHVAFMGMEPYGLANENLKEVWIDPIDYIYYLESAVKILLQRNMSFSIYNHQLCTLSEYLWKFSAKTISEWKNAYFEECDECIQKQSCGGFFESAKKVRSRGIRPIVTNLGHLQ